MERARKITVEIPPELLDKAQRASGLGITQTVRTGLQLVAASETYAQAITVAWQGSFHPHVGRPKKSIDDRSRHEYLDCVFEGETGEDVELLARALSDRRLLMAPPVVTKLLSDPGIRSEIAKTLSERPLLEIRLGFWERAGALGAKVLAKGRKARLGDALISKSCLDARIPLLTRDRDFRAFARNRCSALLTDV